MVTKSNQVKTTGKRIDPLAFLRHFFNFSGLRGKKIIDFLIIYNPKSGSLNAKEKIKVLEAVLKKYSLNYKTIETKIKGDYIPKNYYPKIILVLGGDGTLHKLVNEMMRKNIDSFLIPFPLGVGNDFPRIWGMSTYKFKRFIAKYAAKIIDNLLNEIPFIFSDLGKIEYEVDGNSKIIYFVNSAGINSFDAEVLKNLYDLYKRKAHYHEEYVIPLIKTLFSFKMKEYKVSYTKKKRGKKFKNRTTGFLVYNNYSHASGTLSLPEAKINDGFLNILFFKKVPRWNIPKYVYLIVKHYIFKRLNYELFQNIEHYFENPNTKKCDVVRDVFKELVVEPVFIFQCDGELYDVQTERMKISVLEKALKIVRYQSSTKTGSAKTKNKIMNNLNNKLGNKVEEELDIRNEDNVKNKNVLHKLKINQSINRNSNQNKTRKLKMSSIFNKIIFNKISRSHQDSRN